MSATQAHAIETEPLDDATPVAVPVDSLESTAPEYLRECKRELAASGRVPAVLRVSCRFDDEDTLATQTEADDLRSYVRAAAFLGAGTIFVDVERVADSETAETALRACAERARREGVELEVDGPIDLD